MDGEYKVLLGTEQIGRGQIEKRGLYYEIRCKCRLSGEVMYRLELVTEQVQENIGIPAPAGEWFTLTRRIPVSRVPGRILHISARPRCAVLPEDFVPLKPEEPFMYLHRLKEAYLVIRSGETGVAFRQGKRDKIS